MNIIKIKEEKNHLFFVEEKPVIVCGNSNYKIEFELDEDWQSLDVITAIISLDDGQISVLVEEGACELPPLPNSRFATLKLQSGSGAQTFNSTEIMFDLIPSKTAYANTFDVREENYENYNTKLLSIINEIKEGNIVVNHAQSADTAQSATTAQTAVTAQSASTAQSAEVAQTANTANISLSQVSKEGNEQISGVKNFVGTLQINGENVSTIAQLSNPNLLINGDFKINQRGSSSYSTAGKYTVDRWKLVSGSVTVTGSGISLNGTITQTLEKVPTGSVTASVDQSNGSVTATYSNGVFTITASNVLIGWAKLEIGTVATAFSPKSAATELLDCYRYYYKIVSNGNFGAMLTGGIIVYTYLAVFEKSIPVPMRVCPTLTCGGSMRLIGCYNTVAGLVNSIEISNYQKYSTNFILYVQFPEITEQFKFSTCIVQDDCSSSACIEFDAEIY